MTGRSLHAGAAPTVITPSTSPATTPAREVPWFEPDWYILSATASGSLEATRRVPWK